MLATKIGENTTSILNYYFSFQVYTSIHRTNYLVMQNKFTSYKQYSFFLIFSGNLKKSHTDHIYHKFNKCFFIIFFLGIFFFHKILSIKSCSCTLETNDLKSALKFSPYYSVFLILQYGVKCETIRSNFWSVRSAIFSL